MSDEVDCDPDVLPMRLSRFASSAARCSHGQVERAHAEGRILVRRAGAPHAELLKLHEHVFSSDEVWWDGVCLEAPCAPTVYALLHKPMDVVSTLSDPQGRRCLSDWMVQLPEGAFPVGRLDRETTGALLFTDDGDLAYMLLKPIFHIDKEYELTVEGRVQDDDPRLTQLRAGVDIGDGKALAVALVASVTQRDEARSRLRLVIDEGRHRQVRRMCRAARLRLEHLSRLRIGPLELGALAEGELRALTSAEIEALWEACGGREVPRRRAIAALAEHAVYHRRERAPHARLEAWLEAWQARYGELPERA